MQFCLLDKITELKPGESITAEKFLTGDEEYLADHFPNFPCMPGVLMLEAMFQAACWLLRQTDSFARPIVLMKEVRNVKYGNFVEPGQTLVVNLTVMKVDGTVVKLKGQGTVDGKQAVSGILLLEQFRHADRREVEYEAADPISRREYLTTFRKLYPPAA